METKNTQRSKKPLLITIACLVAAVIIFGTVLMLTQCDGGSHTVNSGALSKQLASEGTLTITLEEDVILDAPLVVNGNKTIVGSGKILLKTEQAGSWPESEKPAWGMGCASLEAQDAAEMPAALQVSSGATLNLGGSVTVDAEGNANGILLADGAELKLSEKAVVKNGRYANLVVAKGAKASVAGGELEDGSVFNILNHGKLDVTGGEISGAKSGANIYTDGEASQSGGVVSLSGLHNVYVAGGSFTMTGGTNDGAAKDGIVVEEGAKADVTGGDIFNCIHGICNNGETVTGKVLLSECGIMNYETGVLNIKGTTVDTSEVYCLANSGGKVTAEDFTAKKCDTVAVYNFSGDIVLKNLTISGGRDGNISNAGGNMTVDGAVLESCRDKSVVVGNGKAVLNNVKINGTSNEKYGVYVFGGELYLNDSSIENISSTAVKADPGSYVELNNVTIKEISQNGFQTDGGRVVINNVTLENAGSHGIYNNGGEVTVNKMQMTGVKKNAVQQKSGTATVSGLTAKTMGNHGAYVEAGTLTVKDSSFEDMAANGFYIIKGENKLILENVTITDAVQQGINNDSVVELKNVTISATGKNGIYNKVGSSMTIDGLKVSDTGEHGVNNKSKMTAKNVTVSGTGKGSNGIQNNGTLILSGASISGSKNHGIYNAGTLTADNVSVSGTADNGVYNDGGTLDITVLSVAKAQGQGVNSNATITLKDVKVADTGKNGVYISKGTAKIENLEVSGTTEHGVNNVAQLELVGAKISATGEGKNGLQNSGVLNVTGLSVADSKNHGIYNKGKLTASDVAVKDTGDNGIYNDGGEVEITSLSVENAKGQGINNNAALTLKDVIIKTTGKNGIYHSKGTAEIENLTVSGTTEHGVNNAADMVLTDATISATGADKNGLQNSGELTVSELKISDSKKHGIYNSGKLTASDVAIKNVGDNGVYNNGGDAAFKTLRVDNTTGHGVNNDAKIKLENVTIVGTGADMNGVQNSGELTISQLQIVDSKKHGIYNSGSITGENLTVQNSGDNGIYNDGGKVNALKEVIIHGAVNQGINNTGDFGAENVTISGTGKNGVLNKVGTLALKNLRVTDTGEHGVNNENQGTVTLTDVQIVGSGVGKNCLQNQAAMVLENVELLDSLNHGIYNAGTLTAKGTLVVSHAAVNGIYNYLGTADLEQIDVRAAGEHGINNAAQLTVGKVVIDNATQNGIQNSGEMKLTGEAEILNSGKHGIYNGGTFHGKGITVCNAADLLLSNSGDMIIDGLELMGTAHKAIYNAGYAELYNAIVTGANVRNPSTKEVDDGNGGKTTVTVYEAEYLIDNNGGVLDLEDCLISNAFGTAIHNRGNAITNVTRVIIDTAGNYGIFVAGGSTLGGDTLSISHVDVNTEVSGAEGIALKIQGKASMLDHVTIDDVKENNAIVIDAATASYSGLGLKVTDAAKGCAIYNKGTMYVTDLETENVKDGVVSRYDGHAVLSGKVTMVNTLRNPITTYGPESAGYQNSVSLSAKAELTIDGCASHAINNKGSFLAAADSKIVIKNVEGQNINAINNNGGTVTLGDAEIDGVFVTISWNKTENKNNTNSGTAIMNSGPMEVNGDVVIKNVFYLALDEEGNPNGADDHTNGAGVVVRKSGSSITGTGSITVIGNQTAPEGYEGYEGIFNGIFVDGRTIDIDGNVSVSNARNQGVYLANANAKLECKNLTVQNVTAGNGVYINNTTGALTVTEKISISDTALRGLGNTQGAVVNAGSIEIIGATGDAIGNGSGGEIYTGSISIKDCKANGIVSSSIIEVTGDVTIDNVGKIAIQNTGTGATAIFKVDGTTTVKNLTVGEVNAIHNTGKNMVLNNVLVQNVKFKTSTNYTGNAIYNEGTITLNGTATIEKLYTSTKDNRRGGGVILYKAGVLQGAGSLVIAGSTSPDTTNYPYGINHGIFMHAAGGAVTVNLTGDITVQGVLGNGIYLADSAEGKAAKLTVRNITVSDVGGNAVYNRTSLYSELTATGAITVSDAGGHGVSNDGKFNAASISVNGAKACGITNAGIMTVTGSTTVSNVVAKNRNAIHNTGTMNVKDVEVDGAYLQIDATISNNKVTAKAGVGNGVWTCGTINLTGTLHVKNVYSFIINPDATVTSVADHHSSGCGIVVGASEDGTAVGSILGGTVQVTGSNAVPSGYAGYEVCYHGLVISKGTVDVNTVIVSEIHNKIGIMMEGNATLEATNVLVQNISKSQGIQANHANTITVTNLVVINIAENGLRLYNNSSNPTVSIQTAVAYSCKWALAAQKSLANVTTVNIDALYYENCSSGSAHSNIANNVTQKITPIPTQVREALAQEGITIPASN